MVIAIVMIAIVFTIVAVALVAAIQVFIVVFVPIMKSRLGGSRAVLLTGYSEYAYTRWMLVEGVLLKVQHLDLGVPGAGRLGSTVRWEAGSGSLILIPSYIIYVLHE